MFHQQLRERRAFALVLALEIDEDVLSRGPLARSQGILLNAIDRIHSRKRRLLSGHDSCRHLFPYGPFHLSTMHARAVKSGAPAQDLSYGSSGIVDPHRNVLQSAQRLSEELIVADLEVSAPEQMTMR
jgi:hypothetical protein